ncbi:MFS transporter [Nonomuraea soli]|uniref:MFS family permease n=1 Tax=Nonomuraea soli TaxID=1032476 RepID=A0A7W0CFM9_9ACTN|nr:MFS transporter [Nonomuraea soli]MBA2890280.1 MFS family permease [Nonomuraea soli]
MSDVRIGDPPRVSFGWMALLSLAQMGVIMAATVGGQILLPSQVAAIDPVTKEASLAVVLAVAAVCTAVANPLFGAMSDRTNSRFGRRRPWIVGGALLSSAALAFLAFQETIAGLVAGWAVAQLAFTAALATAIATVPDQVPVLQRGKASALAGVGQLSGPLLGGVVATVLLTGSRPAFLAMAVLVLALILPFGLFTREPRTEPCPPFSIRDFARGFWVSPRRHPDFAWAWLSRLMITLTLAMGIGYLQYFLRDAVHYPADSVEQGVVVLVAVFTLASVAPTLLAGWLSDRTGRRKPAVFLGGLTMAASALVLTAATTWGAAIAAAALLGAGYGMFAAVDQAMVTQLLPADADRGKDLGIVSLSNSASNTLGPVIAAPLVTSAGGYPLMYAVAAAFAVAGACLVWRIRGVR